MASTRKAARPSLEERLLDLVGSCLGRYVRDGQAVLVAFSGGIDSTVLLHLTARYVRQHRSSLRLSALHVHHGLSPRADEWEAFCVEHCRRLGLACDTVRVVVPSRRGIGLEAAARRARYAAFAAHAADWILLAHQQDDQAETLLANLLRGAGVVGAAAMPERKGRFLRPLLLASRDEIRAYAESMGLSWIDDESNRDLCHSRNFLRSVVLPALESRWPAARARLAAAASRFAEAAALLDDLARLDLSEELDFPLPVACLSRLSEPRAANVLRYLLARHDVAIPGARRLKEAVRQFRLAGCDRHPRIVFADFALTRRRGRLYLEKSRPGK